MKRIWFWVFVAFLFLLLAPQPVEAKKSKKETARLPSVTGQVVLIETNFLSSAIQVKKTGRKGGLQSVRAIVNGKTRIYYKGKPFVLNDIPLHSSIRLEYERVKGVVVARKIMVIKLYSKKPPPKEKEPSAKRKKTT
jgi:hypothetical protein